MTTDKWNGGRCSLCDRPIVSSDDDWHPMGPECSYPNGKSCRAYAEKKSIKADSIVINPNHDDHPLNQAFTKSLKEWLDAGASLSSVLQVLEEECWSREERARIGDPLVKGSTDDWRVAAGEFLDFNEPEGLT